MEFDEDGLGGGGGDDDNVVLSTECEVCGSKEYLSEAGFYYCKLCNTQSQQSRQYIDEEFAPNRTTNIKRVSVLPKNRLTQARRNVNEEKIWVSTWETYNLIIEGMTKALIGIGFPELLRDKVFQIWIAYLLRRKAISHKYRTPGGWPSRVTLHEQRVNLFSLYGARRPKIKLKRKVSKVSKVSIDKDDVPMGLTQAKRRRTMNRRKAFEKEYLAHATQMSELDINYENVTGMNTDKNSEGVGTSQKEVGKNETVRCIYTYAGKKLRSILKSHKIKLNRNYASRRAPSEYLKALYLTAVERFTLKSVLILLFVAARQIGCRVLLTDFIRLFNDGTLYVDSLKNVLEDLDDDPFSKYYATSNLFLRSNCGMQMTAITGDEIETFLDYVGIKNFVYPSFEEVLPKFADDFAFPKEFECLMRELNIMFSMDGTIKDVRGRCAKERMKYLVEVWILATMVTGWKMLFGLDDVTEKYQSRFASTVNRILAKQLNRPELSSKEKELLKRESGGYVELFVLEDWFRYIRKREDVITRELFSQDCYRLHSSPNTRRVHDIMETYGDFTTSMKQDKNMLEHCTKLTRIFQNLVAESGGEIPDLPSYCSMPLPRESILTQYKQAYPKVSHPELGTNILGWSFEKMRIDFIWNPNKYIPMLKKAGYKVKVIHGDAVNYKKKLKFEEKKLILFQPYKKFDEFCPLNCSASMKFLVGLCSNICSGQTKFGEQGMTFFQDILNLVSDVYSKRGMAAHIPLKEPPMFFV